VAENCLQNALEKRRAGPQVQIQVRLALEGGLQLSVCDSGEALPESIARTLFTSPVPSRHGLGVGLYQAARQASAMGYRLALTRNEAGEVCFTLEHRVQLAVTAADPQPPVG
jgi:C4-dicarboxylate-specific signal transduction histidine kinase